MFVPPRTGLLGVLVLSACTVRVEQAAAGAEAECLELFETCVELAGESPGCIEVYQFCSGSVSDTDAGGTAGGGCEQDYISCLQEGGDPTSCQPLLDMCMPAPTGTSGSTSSCLDGDPGCTGEDTSATVDPPLCPADDPSCVPNGDCEAMFLQCVEIGIEEASCLDLQLACETGSCSEWWNVCLERLGEPGLCAELTVCTDPKPGECDQILSECEDQGWSEDECRNQFPDASRCFPNPDPCQWYQGECQQQFADWFCADAYLACNVGALPELFQCEQFLGGACNEAKLSDVGCNAATEACVGGWQETEQCANTSLWDSPSQWLFELAVCNMWEQG